MRFGAYINYVRVMEWQLTSNEAHLFPLLYESPNWCDRVTIDNIDFYHVSRNKVIEELPFITDKPDTVYRLFKSLHKKGVINYKKWGKKDLIAITKKGKKWNHKTTDLDLEKLGNKSEKINFDQQNSEINPKKLGNKSEKNRIQIRKNSEINPTYKYTSNKDTNDKYTKDKCNTRKKNLKSELSENKNPKRKKVAPKKEKDAIEYLGDLPLQKMKEKFCQIWKQEFSQGFQFGGKDWTTLRELKGKIENTFAENNEGVEMEIENYEESIQILFQQGLLDKWRKKHFSLNILNAQYSQIIIANHQNQTNHATFTNYNKNSKILDGVTSLNEFGF